MLSCTDKNSKRGDALDAVATVRRRLAGRLYTPVVLSPGPPSVTRHPRTPARRCPLVDPRCSSSRCPCSASSCWGACTGVCPVSTSTGAKAPDGGQHGRSLLAIDVCGIVICFATGFLLGNQLGISWTPWVIAAILVVGTVVVGRRYDGLLRTQLRSGGP